MNKKLNTLFLGTPEFSVPTLDMLNNHPLINLVGVISKVDKKQGRGQKISSPPVIEYAKSHKIKSWQTQNINKDEELLAELQNIDLIIVLAFSQFLSEKVLNIAKLGSFNIHTSLLPKYRGAAPIQYALLNGDDDTGVSIQRMVKKMDAGDVCLSHKIHISPSENAGSLYTKLKLQAALSTDTFIQDVFYERLRFKTQNEELVSFAPKISKSDGKISFDKLTLDQFRKKLKAFFPWPGIYCFLNDKNLKIFAYETSKTKLEPGKVSTSMGTLVVGLLDQSIRLTEIQLAGKRKMNDVELLNGLKGEISLG